MPPITFATQSYQDASLPLSAQRLVNMQLERAPPDAKSQTPLFGSPGLQAFAIAGNGPIRGGRYMSAAALAYFVSGASLYSVSPAAAVTLIGGGIAGNGNVSMSDNGTQLIIVNGAQGYVLNINTGVFGPITDANFNPANTVTFFDDYFVFDHAGTLQTFVSNLLDGTKYNALGFASVEVQPANVLAVIEDHEFLLIFTEKTVEAWYDAGNIPYPFLRYGGATIERGCGASLSVVKEDNSVFFLGDDGIYYRIQQYTPIRVSTHAIEKAWTKYPTLKDALAFSYSFGGHKVVALTFPTAQATWVYDISTARWHERESWDQNNATLHRWRANCAVSTPPSSAFAGAILIGDAVTGQIGTLTDQVFTEYGNTIRGQAVSAPIHSDRKRVSHSRLELDVETGVGLAAPANPVAGDGTDPQIMLDWSDDGGRSYKPLQLFRTMGKIGDYTRRLRWLKLGQARQRVYRLNITDPVKRVIVQAHLDSEARL